MQGIFVAEPSLIRNWLQAKGFSGTLGDQCHGYFKSKSTLTRGTIEDHILKSLEAGGFTGTMSDRLTGFFQSKTGISNRKDAERAFWRNTALDFSFKIGGIDSFTKLMLHMDDTSLSDSALSPHASTLVGNVARSSTQSKFGGFSAAFDASGDAISFADSNDWNIGTSDLTIDCWLYMSDSSTGRAYLGAQATDANNFWLFNYGDLGANTFLFGVQAAGAWVYRMRVTTFTMPSNTWVHVAVVRTGSTVYFFANGASQTVDTLNGTGDANFANYTSAYLVNGDALGNFGPLNGYIDEYRLSIGTARYTANFTPATQAYDEG